ncbi:putative mitochondrial protein, partial [Tanacetum coccineum]
SPQHEQLRAAALCKEGEALSWYKWSEGRTLFFSWDGFKRRLLIRFQQSQEGNLYEQFLAITQEESARAYVALFEKLACQLVGIPESVMEATFIKGLKPALRAAVRVMNPEGLNNAMELVVLIEDNQLYEGVMQSKGVAAIVGQTTREEEADMTNRKVVELDVEFVEYKEEASRRMYALEKKFDEARRTYDDLGFPLPKFQAEPSTAIGKNRRSDFIELQRTSFGSGFEATGFEQPTGFGQPGFGRGVWTEPQTRVERETHNNYEHRMRKLKMPVFDGEDAYGWIYRVERYFEIQGIPPQEQLRVVVVYMEGDVLSWYRWREGQTPFSSWEEFKIRLLTRFQQKQAGNLYEQFLAVVQDGTAREYVALFEKLACQLVGVSPSVIEATFIKGLKTDLRAAIRVMRPEGLAYAMDFSGYNRNNGPVSSRASAFSVRTPVSTSTVRSGTNIQARQFKQLTETELADKRSKGLCFRCDEKFTIVHRCPSKTLQVLLVMDEEDEDNDENVENKEVVVTVLIDSGATYNFLSKVLVARLGLCVSENNSVGVMLGNGGFEESVGLCKGLVLSLSGLQIIEDFFPFELGSTDAILGIKWLQTLGDMVVNWKELTMSFNMDGDRILIKGDPSLNRSLVSLKSISRSLKLEKNSFLVELKCLGELQEARLPTNEAINDLLKEFEDIFQLPEGLPPIRAQDHAINLCEGKGPISVRPYRYPHAQKGQIEKLVAEMLHAGIIQPSVSLFSSPVLLVKKKMGVGGFVWIIEP